MEHTRNAGYDPKPYLEKYGFLYFARSNAEAGTPVDKILKLAIETFQKDYGLKVTGEVDDETIESMNMARCGNPDYCNHSGGDGCFFYHSMPENFDCKRFLESYGFLGLAQAQLSVYRDLNSVSEEEILELAVKKFQQTYGYRVTGKFEDQETMERMKRMARRIFKA